MKKSYLAVSRQGRRTVAKIASVLLLAAFVTGSGLGQVPDAGAERLRTLNNELLRVHGEAQRTTTAGLLALRDEAAAIIEQRAAALSQLIETNPAQALSFAFSPELVADLTAKFPDSATLLETHGTWQGPVEQWIFDGADLNSFRSVTRMRIGSRVLDVHEPDAPVRKNGDLLQATGVLVGNQLAVSSSATQTTAATPSTTGAQNVAVLLVTFPGVTPTLTPQAVNDIFFGSSGRSLNGFWREVSYGQASAIGSVLGYYTLNGSYTCLGLTQMLDDAIAAASAQGVSFLNYTGVFVIFPDLSPSCGWSGMSSIGSTTVWSPAGSFNASTSYLVSRFMSTQDQAVSLVAHEAGHGLGLHHASSRGFGAEALGPVGVLGTVNEYGSTFSTMGSGLGQYDAPHKAELLNWLTPGNYQTIQTSGTYSLQPLEISPAGLQALKVQRGAGNNAWLWIEYRQPLGNYDSTLPSQVYSGALIHYEDSQTGIHTQLLDFTPGDSNWTNVALAAGQTWQDPYTGVSLNVQSATASALTISVNYGAVPCTHANPSVTLTPSNPTIYLGGTASYTASITNNDSSGCSAGTLSLTSSQPSGWSASLSSTAISLNPGQAGSVTLNVTVPEGATPGVYPVTVTASSGTDAGTGSVNCTAAAPPPPSVTVSVPSSTYTSRQTVAVTVVVLNGGAPAPGITVAFTLSRANGSTVTGSGTTDSNGKAVWSYKIQQKDPTGTYSATAKASVGSQTPSGNIVFFSVH